MSTHKIDLVPSALLRCSDATFGTKRQAVSAMLDLITANRSNQERLCYSTKALHHLFGVLMADCGDYATQVRALVLQLSAGADRWCCSCAG